VITPRRTVDEAAVADHYDDLDRIYREIWGEHVHHGLWSTGRESHWTAVRQLVERVAEQARITGSSRVCDIGCGYGATASHLSSVHRASVTGITLSRTQYDLAVQRTRSDPRIRIRWGNWLENQLPDQSFDAAIAIESTEHMTDKPLCFAEAHRILKPGGRLVVCGWCAGEQPRRWEIRLLLEPVCSEGRLPDLRTPTEQTRLLEKAGLRVPHYEDLTQKVKRTWNICIRRSITKFITDSKTRRYFLSPRHAARNREFLFAIFRIRLAYETGAMSYGMFTAEKPAVQSEPKQPTK
jgi:tocopherol O-methyltransferase